MQKAAVKPVFKILLYGCLALVGCTVLAAVSWVVFSPSTDRLPDEQTVRNQFKEHRADFVRMVQLLRGDKDVSRVAANGTVSKLGTNDTKVPASSEYRKLLAAIGVQDVLIREDHSIEFTMWGTGGAIMSDHYMGVRYVPKDYLAYSQADYQQTVVPSLASNQLPQEKGDVATGLYVVAVEPEWYIYRFEYQE